MAEGQHPKPYTAETLEEVRETRPPTMLREHVRQNEAIEKAGLVALRNAKTNLPDDVMWEIDKYVTRVPGSRNGGRKKRNSRKRRSRKLHRKRNRRSRTVRRH